MTLHVPQDIITILSIVTTCQIVTCAEGGPLGYPSAREKDAMLSRNQSGPLRPVSPGDRADRAPLDGRGFKDTSKVNRGSYTIVRARIDLPSGVRAPQAYVYHCHIVEHEDNDMMQSFIVLP